MASTGKLEVFELIAEDDTTESYLARWGGDTWIVLRRGRSETATRGIGEVAAIAEGIVADNVVRTFPPSDQVLKGTVLLEEYLEGERLSEWMVSLAENPLPWRVAAAIVRDAARGAYAIQTACKHHPWACSELWPGRLVVGFDGSVRIVDPCAELRGAAAPAVVRDRYGAPDRMLETTPAANGESTAAVFALGRILTDLTPADGKGDDRFTPPKAFERIVSRSTAPTPSERYRNSSELAAALDALLDDPEPVQAYFAQRFSAERQAHAHSLAARAQDETATLEAQALGGLEFSAELPMSGFTDEVKTAVMQREVPSAPATIQELPDFEEASDTEELRLDAVLGSYAADADEDIRTRPFRRELIAKLKRTERVVLGKGAERVSVIPTPLQPARTDSSTPDENVIVTNPRSEITVEDPTPLMPPISEEMLLGPVSSELEEAPMVDAAVVQAALDDASNAKTIPRRSRIEPAPNSGATIMIRAIDVRPRSRSRDFVILAIATAIVAAVAFWVFMPR